MKIKNKFEKNFLNNKNILVTGASRGIGKELALTLSSYAQIIFKIANPVQKVYFWHARK